MDLGVFVRAVCGESRTYGNEDRKTFRLLQKRNIKRCNSSQYGMSKESSYKKGELWLIVGYCDADYAGDHETRRSTRALFALGVVRPSSYFVGYLPGNAILHSSSRLPFYSHSHPTDECNWSRIAFSQLKNPLVAYVVVGIPTCSSLPGNRVSGCEEALGPKTHQHLTRGNEAPCDTRLPGALDRGNVGGLSATASPLIALAREEVKAEVGYFYLTILQEKSPKAKTIGCSKSLSTYPVEDKMDAVSADSFGVLILCASSLMGEEWLHLEFCFP
ncbi:hypothetical protein BC332_03783 [Capsicum chinense]|nr:hypothetical protein BC332_03783 [Capsicum chinense]